jgi:hypothetical protein
MREEKERAINGFNFQTDACTTPSISKGTGRLQDAAKPVGRDVHASIAFLFAIEG